MKANILRLKGVISKTYCSWGSQGRNIEVVCHSLPQWTTFCQNSPPWPVYFGWSGMAWLIGSLNYRRWGHRITGQFGWIAHWVDCGSDCVWWWFPSHLFLAIGYSGLSWVPKGVDHTLSLWTFEFLWPQSLGSLRVICLHSSASLNSVCVWIVHLEIEMLKTRQTELARSHRTTSVLCNNSSVNPN